MPSAQGPQGGLDYPGQVHVGDQYSTRVVSGTGPGDSLHTEQGMDQHPGARVAVGHASEMPRSDLLAASAEWVVTCRVIGFGL